MTGLAFVLVAVSLIVLPAPGPSGHATRTRPDVEQDRQQRERRQLVLAALGVLGAGLALLGPRAGTAAAVVTMPVVVVVLRALHRRARAAPAPADRALALTLDLVAAALRAGSPLPDALTVAAGAAGPAARAELHRVAGLLRLGADPARAWAGVGRGAARAVPVLDVVAATATRSAASGLRLASAFERLAGEIRAESAATAAARAHRCGVAAMGPLAACFLPSFVCLGVVPVVVGIAREAVGFVP